MTDQEVLISTLREARRIIGEYTGPRNANQTLTQLVAVLDRQDVAHAREETLAEVRVSHVTVRSFDLIQSTQRKVS